MVHPVQTTETGSYPRTAQAYWVRTILSYSKSPCSDFDESCHYNHITYPAPTHTTFFTQGVHKYKLAENVCWPRRCEWQRGGRGWWDKWASNHQHGPDKSRGKCLRTNIDASLHLLWVQVQGKCEHHVSSCSSLIVALIIVLVNEKLNGIKNKPFKTDF